MKVVIAGNYRQYKQYLQKNNLSPREAIYVSHPEQLRGLRGAEIVKVGEWWLNPCADDDYLEISKLPEWIAVDFGYMGHINRYVTLWIRKIPGCQTKFVWKCRECGSEYPEDKEDLPKYTNPSGIEGVICLCGGMLDLCSSSDEEER